MTLARLLFFGALTFFTFSTQLSAGDDFDEENVDPLVGFSISKEEIEKSLALLKSQGKISQEDYDKAKKELSGLSNSEIESMKDKAIGVVRHDPDKALELVNKAKIDTKEVSKQLKASGAK